MSRPSHKIWAIQTVNEKSFWTSVGVAFTNKDGSLNCVFNFFPTNLDRTGLQIRPWDTEEREHPKVKPLTRKVARPEIDDESPF